MAGFNLFVGGDYYQKDDINLFVNGKEYSYDQLNLYHSGQTPPEYEMNLYASGDNVYYSSMSLHTLTTFSFNNPFINQDDDDGGGEGGGDGDGGGDNNLDPFDYMPIFVNGAENILSDEDNPYLNLFVAKDNPPGLPVDNLLHLSIDVADYSVSDSSLMLSLWQLEFSRTPVETSSCSLYISGFFQEAPAAEGMSLYIENYVSFQNISDSLGLFLANNYLIKWDSYDFGLNSEPNDDVYATVPATDAIRGVQLICYGGCGQGTCEDVSVETHDTVWFDPVCVDGGILRASDVYTNLDINAFGSEVPYSGHFYGFRKLDKLLPLQKYFINIIGQSGSSAKITAPKELASWEYTIDGSDVAYSGLKLIGDSPFVQNGRNAGDQYGSSLSMNGDLLAVGSPHFSFQDELGYTLQDAGTVFLYRRGPEPDFDQIVSNKAGWYLEGQLRLPSGILRDYYTDTPTTQEDGIDIILRNWNLGQEGRNFGNNIHICSVPNDDPWINSDNREIIAVSAPNAQWSRTFPDLQVQSNDIIFFVFTDEFLPSFTVTIRGEEYTLTYRDIVKSITSKNLLYTYYSLPTISLNINIVIFHPIDPDIQPSPSFPEPQPSFIVKKPITRHREEAYGSQEFLDIDDEILDQIKNAFYELYPYDTNKQHNNIPAILGVYVDNSRSLGSSAIEPALSRFKEHYQEYAFQSGVTDVFGNPSSGAVLSTTSLDENWILQTTTVIDFTLDSGRLATNNHLSLLTDPSTFGVFNENLPEFNIPPSSGGCVYLFEKESDSWNLIQQINSPTEDNTITPDLFGKSIKMSEDGSILAIGSPYINEAIMVYERDPREQHRMYSNIESWVDYHLEKDELNERYAYLKFTIENLRASGNFIDGDSGVYRSLFFELSHQEKYDYRHDVDFWGDKPIQEYKHNLTYSYTDIDYKGTYLSLLEEFAPTSRMGYSVAVEDAGESVAFGCPTDSLDELDDTNSYYNPDNSGQILWPSYVNAGAVRVLDSIKYFRHNRVVEYSKFGNKDKALYEQSFPESFDHFSNLFSPSGISFNRTDFSDFEIPEDAGMLMIICPEVDFSNIEVMNRIKNWLNLGDRNLVLVGNDGNFEQAGRFNQSNPILNNILSKLDSSMRLVNTPNTESAALSTQGSCPLRPNILPSFRPENSIDTYVDTSANIFGNGVADIRIHAPDVYEYYTCSEYYRQHNDYCSPPLTHSGDLRTNWNSEDGVMNWPNLFAERFPGKQPPVPLMVAGYYKEPQVVNIPAIPPTSGLFQYYDYVQTDVSPAYGNLTTGEIEFGWTEELELYNSLNTNVNLNSNTNKFFNPPYKMGLNPILQSKSSNGIDTTLGEVVVSDACHLAASESIPETKNSQLFLIGTLATENLEILYTGLGDKNINFYFNMVAKNRFGSSYVAQINSWAGRSGFKDANPDSIIELVLRNTGNTVSTNVSLSQLISGHPNGNRYDVCWVANPLNAPSDQEIETLKKWLNQEDKKIIVTYDNEISAKNAEILLEKLGLTMKPLYLTNKSRYAHNTQDVDYNNRNFYFLQRFETSLSRFYPDINPYNYRARYGFIPSRDDIYEITLDTRTSNFIPINLQNGTAIASLNHGIVDDKFYDLGFYYMKSGTARISFPVRPNTAYRVFLDTAAYSFYEKEPLTVYVTNCNALPSFTSPFIPPDQDIYNLNSDDTFSSVFHGPVGVISQIGGRSQDTLLKSNIIEFHTLPGVDEVSFFISGNSSRVGFKYDEAPSTVALVGISGALVDVIESPLMSRVPRYEWEITDPGSEAFTTTVEFPDPFPMNSNSNKYCPGNVDFFRLDDCSNIFEDAKINDGPVVVAQELYYGSPTRQGINQSRITLISDASIIEGPCIFRSGEVIEENANFIRSLYPDTVFPENENSKLFSATSVTKIIAPERSSPARLFANIGNSGLIERFIPENNPIVNSGNNLYMFNETLNYETAQRPDLTSENSSAVFSKFRDSQNFYGSNSKFNQEVGGVYYEDSNILGGKPSIIDAHGADFIDPDVFVSGYPGDLFGYSIDYHRGKLVVGSPFAAYYEEQPISWSGVVQETESYTQPFGTITSRNGGAGSVYIYEKTGEGVTLSGRGIPWQFISKLRPKSIGVGQDLDSSIESKLIEHLGENDYSLDDLLKYSTFTDQFGSFVKIYSDLLAVGAPGHDYSINVDLSSTTIIEGAFEFKSFNFEYDAQARELIDLGDPEVRDLIGIISGVMNNGAVYTFENKITNAKTKEQSWTLVEKLIPDGYKSRLQQSYDEVSQVVASGTENEHFGRNIALFRPKRTDADYTIAIGTPNHKFATSGTHISGDLEKAGAAFLFDAMLRDTPPFVPDEQCFMNASVFGYPNQKVSLSIDNSTLDTTYHTTGFIYSNTEGEIFIEASGQDSNLKGFSIHRPVIKAVYGRVADDEGDIESQSLSLYTKSVLGLSSVDIPLYCSVPDNSNVYNTLGLSTIALGNIREGNDINLYAHCPSGTNSVAYVGLFTGGISSTDINFSLFSSGY